MRNKKESELKYCKDCNKWLPLSEFYYNSYRQQYEWVCKECFKRRLYKNKEGRREAFNRWYRRLKLDKDKYRAYINNVIRNKRERLIRRVEEVECEVLNNIINYFVRR